MTEWRSTTLGAICDAGGGEIRTGPFGSQLHEADYSDDGVPVIMPKDIATGRVDDTTIARVGTEHVDRLSQHKLAVGDIVYGRRGDIGRKALITEREAGWLCGTGCLRVTVGDQADPLFLFHRLGHPETVKAIQNRAVGATMPNLNTTILREVELTVPAIDTQRRIGSILGAYDDLIEVNRRRVAVLEEMARGLFEEWFVRFRFPGHEGVVIEETPDGPLPQGWRCTTVVQAFTLTRGRSYRSVDLADEGGMPFVNLKCMERDGGFRTTGLKRYTGDFKQAHLVSRGDLVMAVTDMTQERRIVGRTGRIPLLDEPEAVISMDLVKVCPAIGMDQTFLYCWLRNSDFGPRAAQHANGANVLHLSPKAIADLPINIPPSPLQQQFSGIVEPLFALAEVAAVANLRLAKARDLLLPRLISGQLSVEAAERELEDVA